MKYHNIPVIDLRDRPFQDNMRYVEQRFRHCTRPNAIVTSCEIPDDKVKELVRYTWKQFSNRQDGFNYKAVAIVVQCYAVTIYAEG